MKTRSLVMSAVAAAAAGFLSMSASAATVYNNAANFSSDEGGCSWSTVCGPQTNPGSNTFAAQEFSLSSADVLTSATFTELDFDTGPTSVNWGVYTVGLNGLPGLEIASGTSDVGAGTYLGVTDGRDFDYNQYGFSLGDVALTAGPYYFALQGVSDTFYNYLAEGTATSGAAHSTNGGASWASTYDSAHLPSVAISLSDSAVSAAPEPSEWALMFAGVGMIGLTLRQRSRRVRLA